MGISIEPILATLDRFQQRRKTLSIVVGVIKKFGDDRGSSLVALITYYTFVAIFPLMLLSVTIVGIVLRNHESLRQDILNSAVADFPIIGTQLKENLGHISTSVWGTIAGATGLAWGSLGFAQAAQTAMADIWNIPLVERPSWIVRVRSAVIAVLILASSVAVAGVLVGINVPWISDHVPELSYVIAALVNGVAFVGLFRALTPKNVKVRALWPGAVLAGVSFALLFSIGTRILTGSLKRSSELYGFFGIVLGLLALLSLMTTVIMYCAEWNVVREKKLYPRTMFGDPMLDADFQALREAAAQSRAIDSQRVAVTFGDKN